MLVIALVLAYFVRTSEGEISKLLDDVMDGLSIFWFFSYELGHHYLSIVLVKARDDRDSRSPLDLMGHTGNFLN